VLFNTSEFHLLDLVNFIYIWLKIYIIIEEDHEKLKIVSMYINKIETVVMTVVF